jgi:hypothetical protein
MRTVTEDELHGILASVPGTPRVVASGNYATPRHALRILDAAVPEHRLHMLNAQPGSPDREGVSYETAFVGPAMRSHPRPAYFPCRLSLVPYLLRQRLQPDIVLLHTSRPHGDLTAAEPKKLRYRLLHVAARITRSGRRTRLRIATQWPWAADLVSAFARLTALPRPAS